MEEKCLILAVDKARKARANVERSSKNQIRVQKQNFAHISEILISLCCVSLYLLAVKRSTNYKYQQ